MRIFASGITDPVAQERLRHITRGDDLWLVTGPELTSADRAALQSSEVILGSIPSDLAFPLPHLRWLQLLAVGLDAYRSTALPHLIPPVICTNLRGVFAEPMAQSVLAGILAFERGLDQAFRLQAARDWQKQFLHSHLRILQNAEVLLLGGGSVGNRVRELLTAFACTFTVYARSSGDIQSPAALDAALARADIVCAALPDTPTTRGLMDARRIGLLKAGALFCNVGRGSLIDEAALIHALQSGRLRGALIDVTQEEPLPSDHPLWTCPRLILTQHSAAGSHDELVAAVKFFETNLARHRSKQPLLNVIDWARGY